jgi:flavin reductase (DIM6/NTAB) family NADH-FMN oxidoreductase RutF
MTQSIPAISERTMNSEALRGAMRLWASGVTVVTSALGDKRAGVTASSFTSVTLEPPTVLICLQDHIETYRMIEESGVFGVSILKSDQSKWSKQFAGFIELPEGTDRFNEVETVQHLTGAPILKEAVAWMDCKVSAIHKVGTTGIIVGEVVATGHLGGEVPLVYHNRQYFDLKSQE